MCNTASVYPVCPVNPENRWKSHYRQVKYIRSKPRMEHSTRMPAAARAGCGASWMRFRKGSYGYVVYSGVGRWIPKSESIEKTGLAVENNGKVIANLKCSGRNEGEMGPQWFEKAGYQRSDKEEFFIPD